MPYCRDPTRTPNLRLARPVRAHRRGAGRELARALGATRSPTVAPRPIRHPRIASGRRSHLEAADLRACAHGGPTEVQGGAHL